MKLVALIKLNQFVLYCKFLIHSASIPDKAKRDSKVYNRYYGHGIPMRNLENIITCTSSSVTLVFSGTLYNGTFIKFNDFPFPKSLIRNGKCYGDIKITLDAPKIDASYGQEYCRANIDAHLGAFDDIDEEGKVKGFKGEVPLEKNGTRNMKKRKLNMGLSGIRLSHIHDPSKMGSFKSVGGLR